MGKTINIFSYLFHPLFVSIYAVLVFFFFGNSYFTYTEIYLIIIQIVIITIFIPITFYYLLLSIGKVDSIMLADKAQRKLPLLIHAVLLFILIHKSITFESCPQLYFFFFGSLISTLLALIMVFAGYKVSLHMIGITALTVFTMALSLHFQIRLMIPILVLVLCNGFVASSRLQMKAHTMWELVLGTAIGVLPQLGLLYLWL
ncbi:MAG: hypothetical protein CFE23_06310 [Flavobacterium sp. BFFFF1]|uniref:hypothetical protein n=1 Tax=Flavobacterium sp. BFFFF1 TaxID=2015557 RepID=UPI000BD90222|nr:hypothetical protein [Flavobacterium sp. BFFFF1]OYU81100.1 MAG: hypothetical protein CFE23_06310 [Flavobacterium sp. BFFFF1]